MREKSEVIAKFKEWKAEIENQTGRKIKYLHSDNGGEYRHERFMEFCKQQGITRHFTVKEILNSTTEWRSGKDEPDSHGERDA